MESLIVWMGAGVCSAIITILILAIFTWTKCKAACEPRSPIVKRSNKPNSPKPSIEAKAIIAECYQCRWDPKIDPKYAKLFHPVYS